MAVKFFLRTDGGAIDIIIPFVPFRVEVKYLMALKCIRSNRFNKDSEQHCNYTTITF